MENKSVHPVPPPSTGAGGEANVSEIRRLTRELPPADYTLKIESFSQLLEVLKRAKEEKFDSHDFESGGYKWKLSLYPSGNAKRNGDGHISLYLSLAETNAIPLGGEVNAIITFFVFNHIRNNYLTVQDGRVMRFHALKTEHGFDKLLPLSTFNDYSGYLVGDCCVFGAEVCVIKCQGKGEKLSVIEAPKDSTFTWKIEKFSTLKESSYYSKEFSDGQRKWKLQLHPKGDSRTGGKSLSCFLSLQSDTKSISTPKMYVEYTLSIKDQVNEKHSKSTGNSWFELDGTHSWGFPNFMSLSDLKDASKGYLVNDTLIFEAEINRLSIVESL